MSWAAIIDWFKSDGLDWGKKAIVGVTQLILFSLLYFAGRRSRQKEVEAETSKALNDANLKVQKKREEIREEFESIDTPDDWGPGV